MKKAHMDVLRDMLSAVTCPFGEGEVVRQIRLWAGRMGLGAASDAAGNLLIRCPGAKRTVAPWFFAGHMDHPGFLARSQSGRDLVADFIGGVRPEYFRGARAAFFPTDGKPLRVRSGCHGCASQQPWNSGMPKSTAANIAAVAPGTGLAPKAGAVVKATVLSAKPAPAKTHLLCRLRLDRDEIVPAGTVGMWDLPSMRVAGTRLSSRACDDVAGSAAVLCAMGEIARRRPEADVTALFTVAEEAGLIGATAACKAGTIPKGALVVAVETSQAQSQARLGDGVVVRVGDRAWTFDPALTAHITAVAAETAAKDKAFRFTRQLMPGGVCESTAYCLWGYQAAGLCVPLGNYHNQGKGNRIAAEQIDLGDFESLVKLLVALPEGPNQVAVTGAGIRERLEDRLLSWSMVIGKR